MNRPIAATLALAALLAAPALAGSGPGGPPDSFDAPRDGAFGERLAERHAERLTRALDLTEAQQATLATLQTTLGESLRPLLESMRANRDELESLLDTADPDPAAVGAQAIELHRTKQAMKSAHETFEAGIEAMLTETQRAQYDALQEARPDRSERRERFRERFESRER